VKEAGLKKVEIYALQLYTGPMYSKYNAVLRGFPEHMFEGLNGNKYATTITCIVSGIIKLSKLMVLPQDRIVYRGLGSLELPPEFKYKDSKGIRGGVEYALMSTSLDKQVALRYADVSPDLTPTLLEIRIGAVSRGASIRFLSQYPMESEILYPPMSYLEVDGRTRVETIEDGRMVRVIPLEVNANVFSSTIDQIVTRRKSLHISTVEHTIHEIRNALAELLEGGDTQERLLTCPYTARGLHHVNLAGSIVREAEYTLEQHRDKRSAEWYNDERNYDSAVKEAMELMPAALRKFQFWIENPRSHAEVLSKKSLRWISRRKMSDLNRMLEDEIEAQKNPQSRSFVNRRNSQGSNLPQRFTRRFSGGTAIMISESEMGAKEMALELCRMRGAVVKEVDELDVAGDPPLLVAASMGDIVSLRLLVVAGSDIDARSSKDGGTALHMAAFMGFCDCVKFLVEAGADVTARTILQETVFYVAAQNGHLSVLQYLLVVKGEEVAKSVAMVRTTYGWSCAYVAAWNGHEHALRLLIGLGGSELLDGTTGMGWTAAHGAALNGYSNALEALENLGGKKALLAKTPNGSLCSMMACEKGHAEVLLTLMRICGDDFPQFVALNNDGWGCGHEAASAGHWGALQVLITRGGRDLVMEAKNGVTLLVAAVVSKEVCKILLSGYSSSLSKAVVLAKEQLKKETRRLSVENTFIQEVPDNELVQTGVIPQGQGNVGLLWGNEGCRNVCMELVDGIAGRELLAVELAEGETILHGLIEMGNEGVEIAEQLASWGGGEGARLLEAAKKDEAAAMEVCFRPTKSNGQVSEI